METPSSIVTRSQALISASNNNLNTNIPMSKKFEDSEKGVSKSRARTGALTDITNDSPIVGLAMGKLETPSSEMAKKSIINPQTKDTFTPGSGESLLRGQAKSLLQKVDEEGENKLFLNPLDTQMNYCLAVQEEFVSQEGCESDTNMITRSLLFDFSEKSEGSDSSVCSSVVTNEGDTNHAKKNSAFEDDDSSVWSLQVNTSAGDDFDEIEEFEDVVEQDDGCDYSYDDEEVDDDVGGLLDELCEGISKINVNGAKFEGKHTRFVYNSDDEIDGEEECGSENESSPNNVKLKGLPTPKGKHLRFSEDN